MVVFVLSLARGWRGGEHSLPGGTCGERKMLRFISSEARLLLYLLVNGTCTRHKKVVLKNFFMRNTQRESALFTPKFSYTSPLATLSLVGVYVSNTAIPAAALKSKAIVQRTI